MLPSLGQLCYFLSYLIPIVPIVYRSCYDLYGFFDPLHFFLPETKTDWWRKHFSDLKWQQNTAYLFKAIAMTTAWTLTFTARSLSAFITNINSIVLCSRFPSYLLHMYYSPVSCLWCRLFCNSSHQVSLWPLTLDFNHFCPQNFY